MCTREHPPPSPKSHPRTCTHASVCLKGVGACGQVRRARAASYRGRRGAAAESGGGSMQRATSEGPLHASLLDFCFLIFALSLTACMHSLLHWHSRASNVLGGSTQAKRAQRSARLLLSMPCRRRRSRTTRGRRRCMRLSRFCDHHTAQERAVAQSSLV